MAQSTKPSGPRPDQPLASSYARGFDGWSTAYPPELSAPTTLRQMENVYITPENAVKIRPGLRSVFTENYWLGDEGLSIVGGFEHFMATPEKKGLLLAVRHEDRSITFKTFVENLETGRFDPADIFPGLENIVLPTSVRFVRYLQIDNKILALPSDSNYGAVLFFVGATKRVKDLPSEGLSIPNWSDAHKLEVVHPDAAWINNPVKNVARPPAETPTPNTLISSKPKIGPAIVATGAGATFTIQDHGLNINEPVVLQGTTAPGGFTVGTTYYVRPATGTVMDPNTFRLSATSGGATINATTVGAAVHFNRPPNSSGKMEDGNTYYFGYYYTFETDFGESAPSDITVVQTSRGWSQWRLNKPLANGAASEDELMSDPELAMDQLVAILPDGLYDQAKAAGAIRWNLYMFTWGHDTPVPAIGMLVASRQITAAGSAATENWAVNTLAALADAYPTPVPTELNRENYSKAPTAMQGLVAGERLILVNDADGRITWSSNIPGEYINFSPSKGGGAKTLSAGNLEIPINVQLWQNPQAVDTIAILCAGLDGYHSAYYMAPASVQGQSDSTLIMGFEETTATPGTTSPYGVEVFNNGLYHPLEHTLMKSTAQNYIISHKNMSDDISNMWRKLINKDKIVSSQLGDYVYYIVHNPLGEPLEEGCSGNEVWVLSPSGDTPMWSRWLVQGVSLRRIEINDYLYMSITTPDAVFVFDPYTYADEKIGPSTTTTAPIKWRFETNVLGANTRRDAMVHLQLVTLSLGDWAGKMNWGLKGWDMYGQYREIKKEFQGAQDSIFLPLPDHQIDQTVDMGDTEDKLQVKHGFMEWTIFCESIEDEWSYGQVNMARFQFIQHSVNVGYEQGSIQTYEYARNRATGNDRISQNGVPRPLPDPRRP